MIVLNKNISFGTFDTEKEPVQGFITGKKDYILKLAESCKGKVQRNTFSPDELVKIANMLDMELAFVDKNM